MEALLVIDNLLEDGTIETVIVIVEFDGAEDEANYGGTLEPSNRTN